MSKETTPPSSSPLNGASGDALPNTNAPPIETFTFQEPILSKPFSNARLVVDAAGQLTGEIAVPIRSELHGRKVAVLSKKRLISGDTHELAELGSTLREFDANDPKKLKLLARSILEVAVEPVVLLRSEGYHLVHHDGDVYACFALAGKVYWHNVEKPDVMVVHVPRDVDALPVKATSETWRAEIGVHIANNPYLLVLICAVLAVPLLPWLGLVSMVLLLIGGSSLGKTTLELVGSSLLYRSEHIQQVDATPAGLRAWLAKHVGRPVFLEELRQASDINGILKVLFGGAGPRLTSTVGHQSHRTESANTSIIISNERSIRELTAGSRVSLDEGFDARIFEMTMRAPDGAFHEVPPGDTAAEFADQLRAHAAALGGTVWPEWIGALAENASKVEKWRDTVLPKIQAEIVGDVVLDSSVKKRIVKNLSTWAFAGWIASKLGVLPIAPDDIVRAFRLVIRENFDGASETATPFAQRVLAAIRSVIDRDSGRFADLQLAMSHDGRGLLGYRTQRNGEVLFLFFPHVFEELFAVEFGVQAAAKKLHDAGFLVKGPNGNQLQVRLPGTEEKKRFYAVRAAICFDN